MATITVTKGQIGVEDISFMSGGATTGETFSRATSTGGSQSVHKVTAKAIPVEDGGSVFTGTNVEAVLEDIQDGTDAITLNTGSTITAFLDGSSNLITVPTDGMSAASIMVGTGGASGTVAWFYANAAPPGWSLEATLGADTVLAVKATAKSTGTATSDSANHLIDSGADFVSDGVAVGDVAYNTDDNTSALVTNVAAQDLTLASDAFPDGNEAYEVGTRFIDPGGSTADEGSWDLSGSLTNAGESSHTHGIGTLYTDVPYTGWTSASVAQVTGTILSAVTNGNAQQMTAAMSTSGGGGTSAAGTSHTHTISSDSLDRPAAAIGRLFRLNNP